MEKRAPILARPMKSPTIKKIIRRATGTGGSQAHQNQNKKDQTAENHQMGLTRSGKVRCTEVCQCASRRFAEVCNPTVVASDTLRLQARNLGLEPPENARLVLVNLILANAQRARHLFHRPLTQYVIVKYLIVLGVHLLLNALQGNLLDMAFPFLVPQRIQVEAARIRESSNDGSARCVVRT